VDVPNATVMLMKSGSVWTGAVHQLRGRICRWVHEAYLHFSGILTRTHENPAHRRDENSRGKRTTLQDCRGRFEMRGSGELLGQEQSGAMQLRFGDLTEYLNLIGRRGSCEEEFLVRPKFAANLVVSTPTAASVGNDIRRLELINA